MRQFDVFEAPDGLLYCVLQSDLLGTLDTVMMAPLVETGAAPIAGLTPTVTLDVDRADDVTASRRYLLDVPQSIPVRAAQLRNRPPVASLDGERDAILNAVNLLYRGI